MVEVVAAAAVLLLVLGVVGSVVPALPGAVLSLAGVYLYWWHTGYASPGFLALAGFTAAGLAALAVDYFGGAIAARAGGASTWSTAVAAVVGLVLFVLAGPLGMLLGVAGTVFVLELRRRGGVRVGLRSALYATVGMLGSTVAQFLITAAMLAAFLLVVL